jgi:hypothetical protein
MTKVSSDKQVKEAAKPDLNKLFNLLLVSVQEKHSHTHLPTFVLHLLPECLLHMGRTKNERNQACDLTAPTRQALV